MSDDRRSWTWRHAILKSRLPATTRHVLLTVSCHMNDVGEGCYPSIAMLAAETGLSERAVCQHIAEARDLGWLTVTQHGFRGQRWRRNQYAPAWPDCDRVPIKGADPGYMPSAEGTDPGYTQGMYPDDKKVCTQGQSNISVESSHTHSQTRARRAGVCVGNFLSHLRADNCNQWVVANLFEPLGHLPVRGSEHPAPIASLLAMRDDLAMHSDAALAKAAATLRLERSVLPSGAMVRKAVVAAEGPMLTVRAGDEAWDAWLAHDAARGRPTAWLERTGERRVHRRYPPDDAAPAIVSEQARQQ